MKISKSLRWSLALAVLVGAGVFCGVALLPNSSGFSRLISQLSFSEKKSTQTPLSAPMLKTGPAALYFTRIGHNGIALAQQEATWRDSGNETEGTRWECLRDDVTGLWWEAKTNEEAGGIKHPRHVNHTYSWSSADVESTVDASHLFGANCSGSLDAGQCTTQAYVDAINTVGLCGTRDWRLPTVSELKRLTRNSKGGPTIDLMQFPNTAPVGYWTASAYPYLENYAWYVFFAGSGDSFGDANSANHAVRLVRNDPS